MDPTTARTSEENRRAERMTRRLAANPGHGLGADLHRSKGLNDSRLEHHDGSDDGDGPEGMALAVVWTPIRL
jgi:hypothetical protein